MMRIDYAFKTAKGTEVMVITEVKMVPTKINVASSERPVTKIVAVVLNGKEIPAHWVSHEGAGAARFNHNGGIGIIPIPEEVAAQMFAADRARQERINKTIGEEKAFKATQRKHSEDYGDVEAIRRGV